MQLRSEVPVESRQVVSPSLPVPHQRPGPVSGGDVTPPWPLLDSVQSTIPMIRRLADDTGAFHVGMSRFNAFEITGPGVGFWQTLSSLLMVLTLAGTILLGVLAWRRNGFSHRTAVLSAIVIVGAMILANKTLSPQYMIWWLSLIHI